MTTLVPTSLTSMAPDTSAAPTSSSYISVHQYFHYSPSANAAIAFLVFYSIATFVCLLPTLKYRQGSWFMLIVFVTGGCEIIGFIERINLANQVNSLTYSAQTPYIIMSVLQIISPNALALCNYLIVSRLLTISAVPNPSFLLRPTVVAPIFLTSDLLSFAVQGGASGLLVNASTATLGKDLIIVGLLIQLVFFSVFTYVALTVQFRSTYAHLHTSVPNTRRVMRCLWITIAMLYVRSIYRLIEFSSGLDSVISTTEPLVYIFDFTPVLLCFFEYSYDHFGIIKEEYLQAAHGAVKGRKDDLTSIKHDLQPSSHSPAVNAVHMVSIKGNP